MRPSRSEARADSRGGIAQGWRDKLKAHAKEEIKKKGLEKITVEELVAAITPKGREDVPDSVKSELLMRVRKFLSTT